MKKTIGIIMRPILDEDKDCVMKINDSFRKILSSYDVNVIGIFPNNTKDYLNNEETKLNEEKFIENLTLCDAFILQGGKKYYDYELITVKYAYQKDVPLLGICQGMQTMAIFLGGVLTKLKNKEHLSTKEYVHDIIIKNSTLLKEIIKTEKIKVNSKHKEHIINLNDKYIVATHNDIIEAIEDKAKNFFLGTQWHPEDLADENSKKIFNKFIESIKGDKND